MSSILSEVKVHEEAIPFDSYRELAQTFPARHFADLKNSGFRFYQTTFWLPLDREPANIFERVTRELLPLANPAPEVTGVEWWFSVTSTNASPLWLLPCHFDRNDLQERDATKLKFPHRSSVLFLNAVPYGELVVTDQVSSPAGPQPAQPRDARFIMPKPNLYATFPGNLYHGVIGRMWRPEEPNRLRISMAVNYWAEKPKGAYIRDSDECMTAFRLEKAADAVPA